MQSLVLLVLLIWAVDYSQSVRYCNTAADCPTGAECIDNEYELSKICSYIPQSFAATVSQKTSFFFHAKNFFIF